MGGSARNLNNAACACLPQSDVGKIEGDMVKQVYIVKGENKTEMDKKQQENVLEWINQSHFGYKWSEDENKPYNTLKKIDTSVHIEIQLKSYRVQGDKTFTVYRTFSENPKEKDGYVAIYGGVIHEVTINDENKEEEIALYKYLKTL